MRIFCVYGHGKETEVSREPYDVFYRLFRSAHIGLCPGLNIPALSFPRYARGGYEYEESFDDGANPICTDPSLAGCSTPRSPLDMPLLRQSWIDADYTNEVIYPKVDDLLQYCH